jgi:hypothetical protein
MREPCSSNPKENSMFARLTKAGPAAVAGTFVVGGTVAVVNTYFPEVGAFIDVNSAVAGAVGAALGLGGVALNTLRKKRKDKK